MLIEMIGRRLTDWCANVLPIYSICFDNINVASDNINVLCLNVLLLLLQVGAQFGCTLFSNHMQPLESQSQPRVHVVCHLVAFFFVQNHFVRWRPKPD